MKNFKIRIIFLVIAIGFALFFSNDFGIIDIEKTAIITALAIDKTENEYEITVQVAMPQSKNTAAKNEKAVLSTKGSTISSAINQIGSLTGWYPKLSFCNLIIIGNDLLEDNIINLINYFTQTLNVQDSTLLALSEDKAKPLLSTESPLDDLSSFAIQKILLKKTGLNNDIMDTDIKSFSIGYYGKSECSYIPLIKVLKPDDAEKPDDLSNKKGESSSGQSSEEGSEKQSSSGEGGGDQNKSNVFDATTTILFKKGKKVDSLEKDETFTVNLFTSSVKHSNIEINNVEYQGENFNVLLNIINVKESIKLLFENGKPKALFNLDVLVKINDQNSTSTDLQTQNKTFVPEEICKKA